MRLSPRDEVWGAVATSLVANVRMRFRGHEHMFPPFVSGSAPVSTRLTRE
jgi:hypothetical protein